MNIQAFKPFTTPGAYQRQAQASQPQRTSPQQADTVSFGAWIKLPKKSEAKKLSGLLQKGDREKIDSFFKKQRTPDEIINLLTEENDYGNTVFHEAVDVKESKSVKAMCELAKSLPEGEQKIQVIKTMLTTKNKRYAPIDNIHKAVFLRDSESLKAMCDLVKSLSESEQKTQLISTILTAKDDKFDSTALYKAAYVINPEGAKVLCDLPKGLHNEKLDRALLNALKESAPTLHKEGMKDILEENAAYLSTQTNIPENEYRELEEMIKDLNKQEEKRHNDKLRKLRKYIDH